MKEILIEELKKEVLKCKKCSLFMGRKNVVFGEGNINTKILFIGEAPGVEEDIMGKPFVGNAGKFLTELLKSINLFRENIYITNVLKCRPPGNRTPAKEEIETCKEYLFSQIAIIKPKLICTLGRIPLNLLMEPTLSITFSHGKALNWKGIIIFPMYHPAAALHRGSLRREIEADFQKFLEFLKKENLI